MLTIINKKYLLVGLTSFFLGMVIMFFYSRTEINSSKRITGRIVNNCGEALKTSNDLINNCSEAYKTFGSCVTNPESCNIAESTKKLDQLNKDKEQYNLQLKNITQDITSVMSEIKK